LRSEKKLRPFNVLVEMGEDWIADSEACAVPSAQRPHDFFEVHGDQGVRQFTDERRMKGMVADCPAVDLATATCLYPARAGRVTGVAQHARVVTHFAAVRAFL
jgi:hypothetical protein